MNIKKLFKGSNGKIKMKLDVKVDQRLKDLFQIDIKDKIEKALIQSSLIVQNRAKDIAPYLSWTLKRSISVDYSNIKQLYTVVWSNVPYARKRHWENKKNPQTLRYLFRWYEENKTKIENIFKQALNDILK